MYCSAHAPFVKIDTNITYFTSDLEFVSILVLTTTDGQRNVIPNDIQN